MKKTSIAAVNRILKGKSNPYDKEGFWFEDTITGKIGVTDSYCAVMYDNGVEVDGYENQHAVNVSKLFEPFNDNFHEWYSDDRMENLFVKDVIDMAKEIKKNKKDEYEWYRQEKFGIIFNINLMRDVCEALDSKTVGIYYPFNPLEARFMKPIVIIGENGMGLIMPMRH